MRCLLHHATSPIWLLLSHNYAVCCNIRPLQNGELCSSIVWCMCSQLHYKIFLTRLPPLVQCGLHTFCYLRLRHYHAYTTWLPLTNVVFACVVCRFITLLQHGEITNPSCTILKQCLAAFACLRWDIQLGMFTLQSATKSCWNPSTLVFLDVQGGPNKHDMSTQSWFNVGPASPTMDQHYISIG